MIANLQSIAEIVAFLGGCAGIVYLVIRRAQHNTRVAAVRTEQLASAEAAKPARTDMQVILERVEAMERTSESRFVSLKQRIFWTPLLWAVIGALLWALATVMIQNG